MDAPQALRALRDLTLDGSIRLMHTLSTDQTLEQLLEQAKGEKNLQRIRMYLRLLEEYSTYMTRANKRKTLVLLYELLMHPDGDVRRIAGRIMGKILANAGPRYRKERPLSAKDGQMPPAVMSLLAESGELWAEYIGLCLHPDYKISSKHALRISNSLKTICQSLFAACDEKEAGPLVRPLLAALAQDERRMAEAATQSARWNQAILPKDAFEALLQEARACGALGLVAAHSGTVIGVIWPSQLAHDAISCRSAQLAQQFPELECLGISLMRDGGIEIL